MRRRNGVQGEAVLHYHEDIASKVACWLRAVNRPGFPGG